MAESYSDLCILGPDYELLLCVVEAKALDLGRLETAQAFQAKMLERKGLVLVQDGRLRATALGCRAARARTTFSQTGAAFIAARDLELAASELS